MGLLDTLGTIGGIAAAPFTGGASLAPMLIGAAVGAGKHFLVDKPQEEQDKKTAATIMRYSPWTGFKAPAIRRADGFGSVLQGAAMGSTVGGALAPAAGAASAATGAAPALFGGADQAAKGFIQAGQNAANAVGMVPQMPQIAGLSAPGLGSALGGSAASLGVPQQGSWWQQMKPQNKVPMYTNLQNY
jgi:hypothetical protein